MNYNVLLEMSQKLNIEWEEIKRYHYIFNDIGIVPGSVSIVLNPKKNRYLRYKERQRIMHDGIAIAKQKNGNNVIIKLQYNEASKRIRVIYSFFMLDDGLYFIHNYEQNRHGDMIDFSYYDNDSCDTVIKSNGKLDIKTMSSFETKGIMADYSEKSKIFDIECDGGFAHYVSKIDKSSKKRVLSRR